MDTRFTLNNKIRKTHIRIVVYVLMLMMLRNKIKTYTMIKYKRFGSLTFTVSGFLFSVVIGLMKSRVLYKTSTSSLALTLTIKDISPSLSC
jgi:carbohydrate-binding DOMON domain-containing protein